MPTKKQHAAARKRGHDHYDELLAAQHGVCAICGRPPVGRRLDVDHDWATLQVRGLLCWRCNHKLLPRGVDAHLLRKAADYLDDPPAPAVLAGLDD